MAEPDKDRTRKQSPQRGKKPARSQSRKGSGAGKNTGRRGGTSGSRGGRDRNQKGRTGEYRGNSKGRGATGEPGAVGSKRTEGTAKQPSKRRDLRGAAVDLPRWVVDELTSVTASERVAGALEDLGEAAAAFSDGRYHQAVRRAERAKKSAPRDATVREILGLAAYRIGDWQTALRELRTYRRFTGETTHLPVEMDVLRALNRDDDVETAWQELQNRGARPAVSKEGIVVYASHLIDKGRLEPAAKLAMPRGIKSNPFEEDLRIWYVAARIAALQGNRSKAMELRNAILASDPAFPGIDALETLIAEADG